MEELEREQKAFKRILQQQQETIAALQTHFASAVVSQPPGEEEELEKETQYLKRVVQEQQERIAALQTHSAFTSVDIAQPPGHYPNACSETSAKVG